MSEIPKGDRQRRN